MTTARLITLVWITSAIVAVILLARQPIMSFLGVTL